MLSFGLHKTCRPVWQAASVLPEKVVMVRSPSGDIDISTVLMAYDFNGAPILIDNGAVKSR